jgi:hypothetical protein
MIIKFNCSTIEFNELYSEKDSSRFEEKILFIFDTIEGNNNPEINDFNYLDFNSIECFYISITDLEKILKDIQVKNILLDDDIIVDLLDHCYNVYGMEKIIKNLQSV